MILPAYGSWLRAEHAVTPCHANAHAQRQAPGLITILAIPAEAQAPRTLTTEQKRQGIAELAKAHPHERAHATRWPRPTSTRSANGWSPSKCLGGGRGFTMLDTLASDGRFALRSLLKQPGFTVTAALVMAIGIGAVTVMSSTLEAVVLRPLPYAEPDRLVWVWSLTSASQRNTVSAVDDFDYRAGLDTFGPLASYYALGANAVLTGDGEPERVPRTLVSHTFFATLAVQPALGRFFVPAEEEPGAPDLAVIAHALRQRRFGGRPDVLGTPLTIDGGTYEIVGVTPPGLDFPQDIKRWTPMRHDLRPVQDRGNRNFRMFGRLAAGVTIEQARTQASVVASRIAAAHPADDEGWGVELQPMHEVFFGSYRPAMLALLGAVTLLLLIACANVSSLVLARAVSRRHDIAVRLSLGASRGRIAGQLLVEGVALAVVGGALGLLLSALGIEALKRSCWRSRASTACWPTSSPGGLPGGLAGARLVQSLLYQTAPLDPAILAAVAGALALAALAACLVPALRTTRVDPLAALRAE